MKDLLAYARAAGEPHVSAGALWRRPFKSESSTFPSSLHSHHEHHIFLHESEEVTDKDSIPYPLSPIPQISESGCLVDLLRKLFPDCQPEKQFILLQKSGGALNQAGPCACLSQSFGDNLCGILFEIGDRCGKKSKKCHVFR